MLQLYKNQIVTNAAKQQVEIRQLEIDWYINNYWTLSQQAALLAGFAYGQLTSSSSPLSSVSYVYETLYLTLSILSMGLQLLVVVTTTFCCMWGPGLALRGPDGQDSVNTAVYSLRAEQKNIFLLFMSGMICFFVSNIVLLWCYFENELISLVTSFFMIVFLVLIVFYSYTITSLLHVKDSEAIIGEIESLKVYNALGDLDETFKQKQASPIKVYPQHSSQFQSYSASYPNIQGVNYSHAPSYYSRPPSHPSDHYHTDNRYRDYYEFKSVTSKTPTANPETIRPNHYTPKQYNQYDNYDGQRRYNNLSSPRHKKSHKRYRKRLLPNKFWSNLAEDIWEGVKLKTKDQNFDCSQFCTENMVDEHEQLRRPPRKFSKSKMEKIPSVNCIVEKKIKVTDTYDEKYSSLYAGVQTSKCPKPIVPEKPQPTLPGNANKIIPPAPPRKNSNPYFPPDFDPQEYLKDKVIYRDQTTGDVVINKD